MTTAFSILTWMSSVQSLQLPNHDISKQKRNDFCCDASAGLTVIQGKPVYICNICFETGCANSKRKCYLCKEKIVSSSFLSTKLVDLNM